MAKNKGISIIETLIVIGILALLGNFVVMAFKSFSSSEALNKDANLAVSLLNQARVMTLSSKNNYQYGVHFDATKMVLFRGSSYSSATTTNVSFQLSTGVTATTALTGGGLNVIFQRLTGKTTQNGTITFSLSGSTTTKSVTIFNTGAIQIN